jgi:hypothetical protein
MALTRLPDELTRQVAGLHPLDLRLNGAIGCGAFI